MTRPCAWRAAALALALALAPAAAGAQTPAASKPQAQPTPGINFGADNVGKPFEIEADNGIEWRQNTHVYIARGNVRAKRGNVTVFADQITAHYRPIAKPGAAATAAATAPPPGKDDDLTGSNEIYQVEAEGHVKIASETQTVTGDRADYDLDKGTVVVTGKDLKLTTARDTVTARDSLEWHDREQIAVARGNAIAVRDLKRVRADTLTAYTERDQSNAQHITRVEAQGDVVASSQDQIGRGDSGVYNAETGIVTLSGHVRLTRGQNELRGQYAVVDLNNNVSRLLSQPPSPTLTSAGPGRVEGLIVPTKKSSQPQAPATKP